MIKQGICSKCGEDMDGLDEFDIFQECQIKEEEDYLNAGLDGCSI